MTTKIIIELSSTDAWHLNRILQEDAAHSVELSYKCNDRALTAFRDGRLADEKVQSEWADNYSKWANEVSDIRRRLNALRTESQKKFDLNHNYD